MEDNDTLARSAVPNTWLIMKYPDPVKDNHPFFSEVTVTVRMLQSVAVIVRPVLSHAPIIPELQPASSDEILASLLSTACLTAWKFALTSEAFALAPETNVLGIVNGSAYPTPPAREKTAMRR